MNKKTIIIIIGVAVFGIICLIGAFSPSEKNETPEVIEKVEDSITVELTELQASILDDTVLLDGYDRQGNTYTIPKDKIDLILTNLGNYFTACMDDMEVDKVYHSEDYKLIKVYFSDTDINTQDAFTKLYIKSLFEYGLIYQKFSNDSKPFVNVVYYNADGSKELQTYMSDSIKDEL